MVMRRWLTGLVGVGQHGAHVTRVRQASKLGESGIQRRDLDTHAPSGKIRHQLQEGCRHRVALRLGHRLDDIGPPICARIRSPGYRYGANAIRLLRLPAFAVNTRVVVSRELAAGLESYLP